LNETVEIHYHRLPDRLEVFRQALVYRDDEVIITLMERTPLARPVRVGERVILEPGSPAVWFTYPGRWHDIGRFHLADGTFTGVYANVLTPVEFTDSLVWRTTDLFLDVWQAADGTASVLDVDEFDEAIRNGWIGEPTAARARLEADSILARCARGAWPPREVAEWTLERARSAVAPGAMSVERNRQR